MHEIQLLPCYTKPITAGHIGSVADVIAGHVPRALANTRFFARDYQYGFELASPIDISSLGEAVIVNGYCFANMTNQESSEYMKTISGQDFVTTCVFLVPLRARPSYRIDIDFAKPLSLGVFYERLYQQINHPFVFAAFISFRKLHAAAIAKAPVYGENIFDNKNGYYPFPEQYLDSREAFLIGAVADFHDHANPLLQKSLEVVLYNNPFDKKSALISHAHGITLDKPLKTVHEIIPDIVEDALHVFAEQSILTSIHGEIFVIDSIENLLDKKI